MKKVLKLIKKNKPGFLFVGVVGLLFHVLVFQSINSVMILPFLFYWMFLGIVYKFDERYFFGVALFFLVVSVPPFLLKNFDFAEKLSVWEYLFLVLGLIQWFLFNVLFPHAKTK